MSASIINAFPTTLQNGTIEDATVVMTLFSWIQSQTNGNACGATSGSSILKGDGSGNTTPAISGTDYSAGTQALATGILKSTTATGALSIAVAGTDYAPVASPTFTGTVTAPTFAGALTGTATSAASLSAASALPAGTTATTQASTDNTTALATDAFVLSATVGNGQTLQNVGGSRGFGTGYTNSTGRPIFVKIWANLATGQNLALTVGGVLMDNVGNNTGVTTAVSVSALVPNGATYSCSAGGSPSFTWTEVR